MTDIAVLTPAADDGTYGPHWPQVLGRLGTALAMGDIRPVAVPWLDHVESGEALTRWPLVLPLLAWGYHQHHADWLRAVAAWEAAGVKVANPASVLAWNSDKAYLRRMEANGIDVLPTLWTDQATEAEVAEAFDRFGTDVLIVKPTVSGGAWKTLKIARGAPLADAPNGAAMIQPFLPELARDGELSLLYFGGRFSHAVLKTARPGDFRVQSQFGGLYRPVPEPPEEAFDLAGRVLATVAEPLLYARIDMAKGLDGRWLLMEAELIEPDFFLGQASDGGRAFVDSVRAQLDR